MGALDAIRRAQEEQRRRRESGEVRVRRTSAGEVQAKGRNNFLPGLEELSIPQMAQVRSQAGLIENPRGKVEFLKSKFGPDRVVMDENGDIRVDDVLFDKPFLESFTPREAVGDIAELAGPLLVEGAIGGGSAAAGAKAGGLLGAKAGGAIGGPVGAGFGGLAGVALGGLTGAVLGGGAGALARQQLADIATEPEFVGTPEEREAEIGRAATVGGIAQAIPAVGGAVAKGLFPRALKGTSKLRSAAIKEGPSFTPEGKPITELARTAESFEKEFLEEVGDELALTAGTRTGNEQILRAERRFLRSAMGDPLRAAKLREANQVGQFLDKQIERAAESPATNEALGESIATTIKDYGKRLRGAAASQVKPLFEAAEESGTLVSKVNTLERLSSYIDNAGLGDDSLAIAKKAQDMISRIGKMSNEGGIPPGKWQSLMSEMAAGVDGRRRVVSAVAPQADRKFSRDILSAMDSDLIDTAKVGGAGVDELRRGRAIWKAFRTQEEEVFDKLAVKLLKAGEAGAADTIPDKLISSSPMQIEKFMGTVAKASPEKAAQFRSSFLRRLTETGIEQAEAGADINVGRVLKEWKRKGGRDKLSAVYAGDRAGFGRVARGIEMLDRISRQPAFRQASGGKEIAPGSFSSWVARLIDGTPVLKGAFQMRGKAVEAFKDENLMRLMDSPEGAKFLTGAARILVDPVGPGKVQQLSNVVTQMSAHLADEGAVE